MSLLASISATAETITLGGVGSLTPIVKLLGAQYVKKNPGIEVSVVEPPMGSSGGIRALAAAKIDVALSARSPKADEVGQAKPWLQTPLVLATSSKHKSLTRAQVAQIYGGRKTTWDDNKPIRLILRGDNETETKVLRSLSPEVDAAVSDALKRPSLPIAENDLDALESLIMISGSLGTTNLGLVKASGARLTLLAIDGVQPSIKTVEDGSYRLIRQFYLVTSTTLSPSAAAFVAWLNSPTALALARQKDYLSLR
jgi:phosphate transport system substrate-binding protein